MNTTVVNLSPILQWALGIVSVAVTAAIPILVTALLSRLKIANNTDLSAKLIAAADTGAGAAYKYALSQTGGLSNVNVHNTALAVGAKYVEDNFPDLLSSAGVTKDTVAATVTASLGKLLAADPAISAGTPPATAAAPAPASAASPVAPSNVVQPVA